MARPRQADRRAIANNHVTVRFTDAGLAALDAAVDRTAASAESRRSIVTRTDFVLDAVFAAIRAAGVVVSDPVAPLLLLPGEVESTQPSLPGVETQLYRPKRRR
jgi:hypothetical protein